MNLINSTMNEKQRIRRWGGGTATKKKIFTEFAYSSDNFSFFDILLCRTCRLILSCLEGVLTGFWAAKRINLFYK